MFSAHNANIGPLPFFMYDKYTKYYKFPDEYTSLYTPSEKITTVNPVSMLWDKHSFVFIVSSMYPFSIWLTGHTIIVAKTIFISIEAIRVSD